MIVHLDFETRSEVDLKKSGAYKYAIDDSTNVLCVAYAIDGADPVVMKGPRFCELDSKNRMSEEQHVFIEALYEAAMDDKVIFKAHNASFEYYIWNNILSADWNLPRLELDRWRCSAAAASYKSLPRALGKLADALDAPHKKGFDGRLVMLRMCKPVPTKKQEKHGKWYESEEDFKTLMEYCIDDVKAERACDNIIGDLPEDERKLWVLDQEINHRGIHIDVELAKAALTMKEKIKKQLNKECNYHAHCNASQVGKLTMWVKDQGVETDDLRAPTIKKLLTGDLPDTVRKVLVIRRDFATTSLAKYDAALNMEVDGVVCDQFMYHGATTGRWSGKGVQFHNLPRSTFDEGDMELAVQLIKEGDLSQIENFFGHELRPMEVMKSAIRGLAIAPVGRHLKVMDFSQVEARVLAWLAKQEDVVAAFRDGQDLYKFTAAQIYGKDYNKINKEERFIGKTATLALGYQGGAGAFQKMGLNFGVNVEESLAEKVKNDWRKRNYRIVSYWYALEEGAIRAIKYNKEVRVRGRIIFRLEDEFLTMELPSGRKLWYYKPEVSVKTITLKDGNSFEKEAISFMGSDTQHGILWGRVNTYGGKLTENAVQAISRDLLVNAMREVEGAGMKINLHVHDEIVTEDKSGSLSAMKKLVLNLPSWAKGLPLNADGFKSTRYRKE